jgi:hypothetical protein
MIKLSRPPARIMTPGTFPLPGFPTAVYTIGHDAVLSLDGSEFPRTVAVDIEGAGKDGNARYDVKAVTIGTDTHSVIFDPRVPAQFERIRELVNSGRELVYHNSPFDVPIMYLVGLLDLETVDNVTDTLIYARLAEPDERTSKDLRNAANRHLNMNLHDPLPAILKTLGISRSRWYAEFDLDTPNYRHMAASDVILTSRLRPIVRADAYARLTENHPFAMHGVSGTEASDLVEREQIHNRNSLRRTCLGYRTDPEYVDAYRRTNGVRLSELANELEQHGIVPGYSGSLMTYLDSNGFVPDGYPRTPKTKLPSGKAEDVEQIDHPIARKFIEHKRVNKTDADYLTKIMFDSALTGRTHPTCSYLGAATGRAAYGKPPIHQLPDEARGVIIPDNYEEVLSNPRTHAIDKPCDCPNPKGFVSIDWSQIEPVLAANVAGDLEVLKGYEAGTSDLYSDIASFAKVIRKTAKVILLAGLYGEGLLKLAYDLGLITYAEMMAIKAFSKKNDVGHRVVAEELGIAGFREAIEIRNRTFEPLPKTFEYMQLLRDVANEYKLIPTLSGRIVPIPSGWWDGKFSVQTHKGINFTFQGGAYDVLSDSLLRIHKAGLRDAVYLHMHDEIIADAEAAHDIRQIMQTPPERLCHLTGRTPVLRTDMAHLGERWRAA